MASPPLPAIPLLPSGPDFPLTTLDRAADRTRAFLDLATRHVPQSLLRIGDTVSRRWLLKSRNPYLREMDAVAERLKRPGVYFFSVNYEWGCTCRVGPSENHGPPRLVRVLDWRTPGLGRHVVAADITGAAGRYLSLTWPGYTGVLQAVAPGRFAAAINQAPMRKLGGGFLPTDWAAKRVRVWRVGQLPAAHLLREVFETSHTYAEARRRLTATPIAAPAIFSLVGTDPDETCVIERTETEFSVHEGQRTAANHWQTVGWSGHGRGIDSHGRAAALADLHPAVAPDFRWLEPPILNPLTRLVMVASPADGRAVAQGYEEDGPATAPLVWEAATAPVA
jgi:hypothetical protein